MHAQVRRLLTPFLLALGVVSFGALGALLIAGKGEGLALAAGVVGCACLAGLALFWLPHCIKQARSPERRIHRLVIAGDPGGIEAMLADRPELIAAGDEHGGTPLHRAALEWNVEVARLLLERGADANAREARFGFTPLHVLACPGCASIVRGLHPRAASRPRTGQQENAGALCALLIEAGAEVDAPASFNRTPLLLAAMGGHPAVARQLLAAGADLGVRDDLRMTVLHYAAYGGRGELVELLLGQGADLEAQAELAFTPLHTAAERGHTGAVEALLAHGADPQARTHDGSTPAAIARKYGHAEVAAIIEERGGRGPAATPGGT